MMNSISPLITSFLLTTLSLSTTLLAHDSPSEQVPRKNIFQYPIETKVVKIEINSKEDLSKTLENFVSHDSSIAIFDRVEQGKVTLQIVNDYNFKNPNKGPIKERNDDVGFTHGFKIGIHKDLAPQGFDKYFLTISYETNLHTSSDRPAEFSEDYTETLYLNEDGYWQADVYFKEENLITLMLNKVKQKNAFYWSAGGGYHEINADDANRGFLISGVTQQSWHHRNVNDAMGATLREYNYLEQPGVSQSGVFIKGSIGQDITVYETSNNRGFIRPESELFLTQIENASYLGGSIEIGHDFETGSNSIIPDIRLSAKYEGKYYTDKSSTQDFSVEAGFQTKYVGVKFKYTIPKSGAVNYLNPLPSDFENRESLAPKAEPTFWLLFEGKLPK